MRAYIYTHVARGYGRVHARAREEKCKKFWRRLFFKRQVARRSERNTIRALAQKYQLDIFAESIPHRLVLCAGFVLPSTPKRKRRPKASFSFWCGRWDLNPHVMDTRTSNVPVCRFQHFRIALYYYTILFPVVKTVSWQTPSKIRIKFRGQRGLTFWNHYEVF